MRHFKTFIMPSEPSEWLEYPLLSQKISDYIINTVKAVSDGAINIGSPVNTAFDNVLVYLKPCPALSIDILSYLTEQASAVLMTKGEPLAVYGPASDVIEALAHEDVSSFEAVETPPGDAAYVFDTESAYRAQELLRERINTRHLKAGVMLISPQTTHIAPDVTIGKGSVILPGCLIYSGTKIGQGCKIGPNCILEQAVIEDGASLNNAQVSQSSIGENTTVGPYCWIRPGCKIGSNVRLGDFVELKKAVIGNGTKVSHLTYIGDAEFGEHINVGCGTVVVNYDGKGKYLTTVGDNSFIGCNVNLISPVAIGKDTFIAAGSTITEDVEDGAFAIARNRQTIKPGWVEKRRESGKL
ncbi:MAG: DapH/DapD/GlmU-related protein [Clostridiaceae bacterium]|nr:DapH/DapD/GlmU-related protein [Clostridiaceae bacterium]